MTAADHLQVPRQHGLFNHHGIDLGDGSVAHYLEGRQILRSPLAEFSRGEAVSVVSYSEPCSPPAQTLRRALSRLGEQNYNQLFNNCEHFAHWCKTGRHRSAQVEDWLHQGSMGALALGQLMPAALLSGARLLLRQGLNLPPEQLENAKAMGRRSLEQLDRLRLKLQQKLETELARAEARWGDGSSGPNLERLRLAAQALADQLSEVEEMEMKLERLLEAGEGQ
jgi:hypothetical protein